MGLLGDILSGGPGSGAASAQYYAAINALNKINVPTLEEQRVELEKLVQQGIITPEEVNLITLEPSAMEEVQIDPRFRQAQINTLQKLQDIVDQGGLTAVDKARLQDVIDAQNTEERGAREAIIQSARERGIGGSDFELAQQAIATQGAANRAARQGMDVAALAEQRALDAMIQQANLGGQLESRDFSQQSEKAKAKDIINQFNAANRQNVEAANVTARNEAQKANLGEKARVADANTVAANAERVRRANLIQQKFQNELAKAQSIGGLHAQLGQIAQEQANKQFGGQMGLIGAVAPIVAGAFGGPLAAGAASGATPGVQNIGYQPGIGQRTTSNFNPYINSDVLNKEDIKTADMELDEFMSTLQPYRYKYKDKSMGDGEHMGVMANDMAKSPVGMKIVVATPKGLAIDTKKGFGVLAAAIGRLNKKLEESKNGL